MFEDLDSRNVILLVLFDVSAAFDTVDHSVLLQRLKATFGISELPLRRIHVCMFFPVFLLKGSNFWGHVL